MILSMETKKGGARIFVEDLIVGANGSRIILLSAYGPTQEVRAAAQYLRMGASGRFHKDLNEPEEYGEYLPSLTPVQGAKVRVTRLGSQVLGLVIVPDEDYLVGKDEEAGKELLWRLLRNHAVAQHEWVPTLWEQVIAERTLAGGYHCWRMPSQPQTLVASALVAGVVKLPAPALRIETRSPDESSETPEPETIATDDLEEARHVA